ncbi:hypothetical protein QBC47DRAFT_77363 [Echria macrotheca]|uniref:Proteophosphoglycan 5 n=1 Tax=Echria macrotheca TaxID=438768 RepID=A0AAJ0B7K2_9PEZI|nr:hypothetical protein QBC47DRAFT_77363 [Echria macrotheca]
MELPRQNVPNPPRGTPNRRRGNRTSLNSPARRTYASENDMAEASFPLVSGGESPLTPQKSASNSPGQGSQPNHKAKSRSGNKSRSKQVTTSPAPPKQGRYTPPQTAASKAAAATAFAGATFHASPAPASLPIPSFLKALDSPGLKDTGAKSEEPSPPASDPEAPTPQPRPLISNLAREESPLDIFFRADRAEKERARRASSANILAPNPGPFSPPVQPASPQEPRTLPNGLGAYRRRPTVQRNSSTGISASELDGTPGRAILPAFSTPYQERIRAAGRSTEKAVQPPPQDVQLSQKQQASPHEDMSERLKRFLAIPTNPSQNQNPQAGANPAPANSYQGWSAQGPHHIPPSSSQPPTAGRGREELQQMADYIRQAPVLPPTANQGRPAMGPQYHPPPAKPTQEELHQMEDSLRRALKIGPRSNGGGAHPNNFQSS